jgi:hypothetical protein
MSVTSDNQLKIVKKQGEFFGYPKCCVNAFIRRLTGKPTKDCQYKAAKSGFIPCSKHANLILNKQTSHGEIINAKRVCSIPFNEKINVYEIEFNKSERFNEWLRMVQEDEKNNKKRGF